MTTPAKASPLKGGVDRGVDVLGAATDLEANDRRLGFFRTTNDNIIELASPLR